jgi:hypothetical protein
MLLCTQLHMLVGYYYLTIPMDLAAGAAPASSALQGRLDY